MKIAEQLKKFKEGLIELAKSLKAGNLEDAVEKLTKTVADIEETETLISKTADEDEDEGEDEDTEKDDDAEEGEDEEDGDDDEEDSDEGDDEGGEDIEKMKLEIAKTLSSLTPEQATSIKKWVDMFVSTESMPKLMEELDALINKTPATVQKKVSRQSGSEDIKKTSPFGGMFTS